MGGVGQWMDGLVGGWMGVWVGVLWMDGKYLRILNGQKILFWWERMPIVSLLLPSNTHTLSVAFLIKCTLCCNFLSSWWLPLEFVNISTPSSAIEVWGDCKPNSSAHVSVPKVVSLVEITASPNGTVVWPVMSEINFGSMNSSVCRSWTIKEVHGLTSIFPPPWHTAWCHNSQNASQHQYFTLQRIVQLSWAQTQALLDAASP